MIAPDFELWNVVTGNRVRRDEARGPKGLLLLFICRHCPYVTHVQAELAKLGREYAGRGVGFAAICANDSVAHPEDLPQSLAQQARIVGFTFPYLHDASQEVAQSYGAVCTPDSFLFAGPQGSDLRLAYRGQIDDSRPENGKPVTGRDLRGALDAVITGQPVTQVQHPSVGCSIKWK